VTGVTNCAPASPRSVPARRIGPAPLRSLALRCALALLPLAGCGGGDLAAPRAVPAALVVVAGNEQEAAAGTAVAQAPTVEARDRGGAPLAGVSVSFTVTGGGGTAMPDAVVTRADGRAALLAWVLGPAPGQNSLRAAVAGLPDVGADLTARGIARPPDPDRSGVVAEPDQVRVGETGTVTVTLRDALGHPVPATVVRLSASDSALAFDQPAPTARDGTTVVTFRGRHPGSSTVTADAGGIVLSQHPAVTVAADPVASAVTVDPASAALLVGQTAVLSALVLDQTGGPLAGAAVHWSSGDRTVAEVDERGRVAARGPGHATITATSGRVSGTAHLTVSLAEGTLTGVTYCRIGGVADLMDVSLPSATHRRPLPVAVHIHGGGWTGGRRSTGWIFAALKPELLARGYLVVSLDYRLAPAYRFPSQVEDVKCAIRHLRAQAERYGLDPDRIGVWGGSAGAQLVGLLGTTSADAGFDDAGGFPDQSSRVQAVTAISAITDLTRPDELHADYRHEFPTWPDPASPELAAASPLGYVTSDDPPFFFLVGDRDTVVDNAQSARMDQRLRAAGVTSTLLTVRHADHDLLPAGGPTSPSQAELVARIADFFDRYLRR
jgi:acetyl esterase/lipase